MHSQKFCVAQGLEEAVAEEFGQWGKAFLGHAAEAAFVVEQAVGVEEVQVRMEDEGVAEGVDGSGNGDPGGGRRRTRTQL